MSLATIICPKPGKLGKQQKKKIPSIPNPKPIVLPLWADEALLDFQILELILDLKLPKPCDLISNNLPQ